MRMNLTEAEVRVLASLMEKELATPESYPLSVNALTSACNQKSNRDPVLSLGEAEVVRTLESLGTKGLARLTATGGRVPRYRHSVADKLRLEAPARAVLAELMLRGPQTAAELRSRGERMAPFPDIDSVLNALLQHGPPLIALLPRQIGRKEQRYVHLFCGMPELGDVAETAEGEVEAAEPAPRAAAPITGVQERGARLEKISQEVVSLRSDIAELRQMVQELVGMFQ